MAAPAFEGPYIDCFRPGRTASTDMWPGQDSKRVREWELIQSARALGAEEGLRYHSLAQMNTAEAIASKVFKKI